MLATFQRDVTMTFLRDVTATFLSVTDTYIRTHIVRIDPRIRKLAMLAINIDGPLNKKNSACNPEPTRCTCMRYYTQQRVEHRDSGMAC